MITVESLAVAVLRVCPDAVAHGLSHFSETKGYLYLCVAREGTSVRK